MRNPVVVDEVEDVSLCRMSHSGWWRPVTADGHVCVRTGMRGGFSPAKKILLTLIFTGCVDSQLQLDCRRSRSRSKQQESRGLFGWAWFARGAGDSLTRRPCTSVAGTKKKKLPGRNGRTPRAKPPHPAPTTDTHNPPDNTHTPLGPPKCQRSRAARSKGRLTHPALPPLKPSRGPCPAPAPAGSPSPPRSAPPPRCAA